ncbi:MAG: hypothetical protein R2737_00190 [Candidatus Nanopelagicales bacterium]
MSHDAAGPDDPDTPSAAGPGSAAEAVTAYARTFLARIPPGHAVVSPLGAWLLRAMTLDAGAAGPRGDSVTGGSQAAAVALGLLADPHPLVRASAALWTAPDVETERLAAFRATLGSATTGPIPSQRDADAWAAEATDGMVPAFPLALDPLTVLVLANALATRVSWSRPLGTVPAAELAGPFEDLVASALTTAYRDGQRTLLAATDLGLLAAHVAQPTPTADGSGLAVVNVLGPPDATPADVHAAALDVARLVAAGGGPAVEVDPFDAPSAGPGWTVETGTAQLTGDDDRDRVVDASARLPAWSATTDLDLLPGDGSAYGIDEAVAALTGLLPPEGGPYAAAARQSAYAAFTREGFEAAAVSAIGLARGAPPKRLREVPSRTLVARFGRPYAVCAVATGPGPWHGVPVFSAWVEHPDDAA